MESIIARKEKDIADLMRKIQETSQENDIRVERLNEIILDLKEQCDNLISKETLVIVTKEIVYAESTTPTPATPLSPVSTFSLGNDPVLPAPIQIQQLVQVPSTIFVELPAIDQMNRDEKVKILTTQIQKLKKGVAKSARIETLFREKIFEFLEHEQKMENSFICPNDTCLKVLPKISI